MAALERTTAQITAWFGERRKILRVCERVERRMKRERKVAAMRRPAPLRSQRDVLN